MADQEAVMDMQTATGEQVAESAAAAQAQALGHGHRHY